MQQPGAHPHKWTEKSREGGIVEDECTGDFYDEHKPGCGRLRRRFAGRLENASWGRK